MTEDPTIAISIVLPCHNEEKALNKCLLSIRDVIEKNSLSAEIIVVDNQSTDSSRKILLDNQKRIPQLKIVEETNLGYGAACIKGLMNARGTYMYLADCDNTYDFNDIPRFIEKLDQGYDLVVGNRFQMPIEKGAMPWLHKYIGNPLLSRIVKIFFNVKIGDIHCGARAITKNALGKIVLYTRGMEFASEMVVKAAKQNLKITEIPISYKERIGISKLRSFSDGWRHLRFILLYSPLILFFIPGAILFFLGIISLILLYLSPPKIFGIQFYIHPIFLSSLFIIGGYQLVLFAAFARTYAIAHLGDKDSFIEPLYRHITIEKAGLLGIISAVVGGGIYLYIFIEWISSGFGSLNEIKNAVVALTFVILGIQTFFSAFMLSILGIKEK